MTDPEHWPWFIKLILFPPMVAGVVCAWLPLAESPKWRKVQIGLMVYLFLFGIIVYFGKHPLSVIDAAVDIGLVLAVVALSLLAFLIIRWRNSIH